MPIDQDLAEFLHSLNDAILALRRLATKTDTITTNKLNIAIYDLKESARTVGSALATHPQARQFAASMPPPRPSNEF